MKKKVDLLAEAPTEKVQRNSEQSDGGSKGEKEIMCRHWKGTSVHIAKKRDTGNSIAPERTWEMGTGPCEEEITGRASPEWAL